MVVPKNAKQKLELHKKEIKEKIDAIKVDTHWFRRVFHTFAASFLMFYLFPDELWATVLKISLAVLFLLIVILIEYYRIKGRFDNSQFFGLRKYETKRPAGYLYFGVAMFILLIFFPPQIAIPCILCACFADPIIGEVRHRFGKTQAYFIGFLVCMFFFLITWFRADITVLIPIALIGASSAVLGETKKFRLIDDDFMIQMLPAILILIIWLVIKSTGVDILPDTIIHPLVFNW